MKFQKTYLSRAMTRAMALDHPIGDPTGGAAYGEKNDPVSAVMSVAAMGSTYAAAGTFAAMTLTQGLVFAGAALSLVGNITGNKTLSKIGMITGIAGGVGMLTETITGNTIGGDWRVGELAGETAKVAPGPGAKPLAGTPPTEVAQSGGPQANAGQTVDVQNGAPSQPVAQVNANAPTSYDMGGNPVAPGSPAATMADPTGLAELQQKALEQEAAARAAAQGTPTAQGAPAQNAPTAQGTPAQGAPAAQSAPPGSPVAKPPEGLVGRFMDFTQKNPMLAYIGAQAIGGVGSYMTAQDEREYAEKLRNERLRRLNAGYQNVNQGLTVTPQMAVPVNPQQFASAVPQIQPAGLIAGVRA